MKYAGIIKNDISAAPGICVTFFAQGCPFHCKGCHNSESWDFDGGKEFTAKTMKIIIDALQANGVHRNLCFMGGEPLCSNNAPLIADIIKTVKERCNNVDIYIWTGYKFEDLQLKALKDDLYKYILNNTHTIIDGQYIEELRDVTLYMRGSSNQRIIKI